MTAPGARGPGRPAEGAARVQFRVTAAEVAWLEARRERMLLAADDGPGEKSSADLQARRELRLHRQIIAASLAEVPAFTVAELDLLAWVAGDQMSSALSALDLDTGETVPVLWREMIDAVTLGRVPDDAADFAALLGKLKGLTAAQDHALRDALARHVTAPGEDEPGGEDAAAGFAAAGLRVLA